MPAGLSARDAASRTVAKARWTSAWPGRPKCPRSAARSGGPTNSPSTPSVAAIRVDRRQRAQRLDLHQQADLVLRPGRIVAIPAEAIGPLRDRDAAQPARRIARRLDRPT